MTDQLVSYQTAVLAKSKSFNLDCDFYYSNQDKLYMADYYEPNANNFPEEGDYLNYELRCAVPTQTNLSKWLREVHGIHITVYWNGDKNYDYSIKTDPTKILNHVKHCDSYEEALELALVESLNLIK